MKFGQTIPFLLASSISLHALAQTNAVRITASAPSASGLSEERRIGETARPEWTSARRFAGTRIFIQKEPWEIGVEQWWRVRHKRDGTVQHRLQEEFEIGLPYRMQLDLYWNIEGDNTGAFHFDNLAVELRWAQICRRALESRRV